MEEARPLPEAAPASRPGLMEDPTIRLLVVSTFLALIVLLSAVAALVWYSTRQAGAPRTQVEHDLAVAQMAVNEQPKDINNWIALASAQARSGQYSAAEQTVSRGRAVKDSSQLDIIYADVANREGNRQEAIRRYEVAKSKATAEWAAKRKALQATDTRLVGPNDGLITAAVGEGQVYIALGDYKNAKAQFDTALQQDQTMADVRSMRADAEVKLGDTAAARSDYKTALQYDPNQSAAKKGLAGLGKEAR